MSVEFLVTSLIVIVSPGTGVLYTLATGLSRGSRASVVAAFGCTIGIVPHMAAAIMGLAALLHTSALAFETFKYLGVAYLLYMAWNTLRERGSKGKPAATYQLTSEPRRLPPPNGLCNLETGPETFQLITSSEAQAAQLKGFIGKEISVKVGEIACAQDAGQMSEAVVTKWSVVTKH